MLLVSWGGREALLREQQEELERKQQEVRPSHTFTHTHKKRAQTKCTHVVKAHCNGIVITQLWHVPSRIQPMLLIHSPG